MQKIKLLVLGVDGTQTDGRITYHADGRTSAAFHAHDGMGIRRAMQAGIQVMFCTERNSSYAVERAKELGVIQCLLDVHDKDDVVRRIARFQNIKMEEVAYIGDDLNDLKIMKACGFSGAPADACREVTEICDYVAKLSGGHGAVREVIEWMLVADPFRASAIVSSQVIRKATESQQKNVGF